MNTKHAAMLAPCPKCPFRSDVAPFITAARAKQITSDVLAGASFHCHRTTTHNDDGDYVPTDRERMCAGAVILARKAGRLYHNQMIRISERLGSNFDDVKESAPVYDTAAAMVRAHKKAS
jgi:hypothetical protein